MRKRVFGQSAQADLELHCPHMSEDLFSHDAAQMGETPGIMQGTETNYGTPQLSYADHLFYAVYMLCYVMYILC